MKYHIAVMEHWEGGSHCIVTNTFKKKKDARSQLQYVTSLEFKGKASVQSGPDARIVKDYTGQVIATVAVEIAGGSS